MMTAGKILDFILENRGVKTFKGYTKEEIAAVILEGIENRTLYYAETPDGKVSGMILAIKVEKDRILFVVENLSMSMRNLKAFARKAYKEFPGYKLEAMRHEKIRHFNTDKLYKKLGASL